jgi:hypothetical protein
MHRAVTALSEDDRAIGPPGPLTRPQLTGAARNGVGLRDVRRMGEIDATGDVMRTLGQKSAAMMSVG